MSTGNVSNRFYNLKGKIDLNWLNKSNAPYKMLRFIVYYGPFITTYVILKRRPAIALVSNS